MPQNAMTDQELEQLLRMKRSQLFKEEDLYPPQKTPNQIAADEITDESLIENDLQPAPRPKEIFETLPIQISENKPSIRAQPARPKEIFENLPVQISRVKPPIRAQEGVSVKQNEPQHAPELNFGFPEFQERPDKEQWLDNSEREPYKQKLRAALADRMARRAEVTSKKYYDNAEDQFAHQERVADFGALGGLLLNAGDRMGTVMGRGPASNFGDFSRALDASRQNRIENILGLRGMEEQANMNDLSLAKYVTELDQYDDKKNLAIRQMYIDAMRKRLGKKYEPIGFSQDSVVFVNPSDPTDTKVVKMPAGAIPKGYQEQKNSNQPKYEAIGSSDSGVYYVNPQQPSQGYQVQLPPGVKPFRGKESGDGGLAREKFNETMRANAEREKIAREKMDKDRENDKNKPGAEVAKNFESDYAKKTQIASVIERELAEFDRLRSSGDIDGAVRHGEGMLKALNSAFGADAVGAEEAQRLGGYLKPFKFPWEPGSMLSRDLDEFSKQVAAKRDVLKNAAQDSFIKAQQIREGGLQSLQYQPKPTEKKEPSLTDADHDKALQWAEQNPNDPRAAAIKAEAERMKKAK